MFDGMAGGREGLLQAIKLGFGFVFDISLCNKRWLPVTFFGGRNVEVEEGGIEFAADLESPIFVPFKRWTVVVAVLCEGFKIPCGVGKFKGTG